MAQSDLPTDLPSRIWARDVTTWHADPGSEAARSIANRLGWLDVPKTMPPELERVEALAAGVVADGIRTVYLLGMGGSSLCAEVMRMVYGVKDGYPDLDRHGHDRRAYHLDRARQARAAAHAVPRLEQERWHHRTGVDGEAVLGAHDGRSRRRDGETFRRGHGRRHWPGHAGAVARLPGDFPEPVRHRRSVLGALAVRPRALCADRRAGARPAERRRGHGRRLPSGFSTRTPAFSSAGSTGRRRATAATSSRWCCRRRCARLACGSNSWWRKARASTTPARCPSSTSRSAPRASTATIAASSRSRPIASRSMRRGSTRSRRPATRCCACRPGPRRSAPSSSAGSSRRR